MSSSPLTRQQIHQNNKFRPQKHFTTKKNASPQSQTIPGADVTKTERVTNSFKALKERKNTTSVFGNRIYTKVFIILTYL